MKTNAKQILLLIAIVQTAACSLFESQLSNAMVNRREEHYSYIFTRGMHGCSLSHA
jgi:hypothetical protein